MPGFISHGFKNEVAIIINAFVPDHPEAKLKGAVSVLCVSAATSIDPYVLACSPFNKGIVAEV
jgi:hypothetical protein